MPERQELVERLRKLEPYTTLGAALQSDTFYWTGLSRAKTWEDQGISDREVRDRLKQARDAVGVAASLWKEADDA